MKIYEEIAKVNSNKIKKRIFVLNHFYGMPGLEDGLTRKSRYVNLLKLLGNFDEISFKKMQSISNSLILYNQDWDKEFLEILHIAKTHGWDTQYIDEKYGNCTLPQILEDFKINCNPDETHIILGGTNLSGCVMFNSNLSLFSWIKLNYNVTVELSLCSEYQHADVTQALKNNFAFSELYNFIKANNFWNKVDVGHDINKWR